MKSLLTCRSKARPKVNVSHDWTHYLHLNWWSELMAAFTYFVQFFLHPHLPPKSDLMAAFIYIVLSFLPTPPLTATPQTKNLPLQYTTRQAGILSPWSSFFYVKTAQHDRHQPKYTGAFNYTFFLHFHFPTARSIQTLFDKQQNICFCEFVKNLLYATSQTELCCLIKTRGCLVADSKEFDLASLYEK